MQLDNVFSFKTDFFKNNVIFQLIVILLTIFVVCLVIKNCKHFDDKSIDKNVFYFGICFFILELYKQLFYNVFSGRTGYDWSIFPFQLCSTPLYVCLIAPFTKGKIKKAFYVYLSSFCMLGGLSVLIFPSSVIVEEITITFQSFIWHSSMVVLGCYLIHVMRFGKNLKELLPGVVIFLIVVFMAVTFNYVFEIFKEKYHLNAHFNMLFISPYYECNIQFYSIIWNATNWYISVFAYIVGLCLGSMIIWGGAHIHYLLDEKRKEVEE